MAAFCCFRFRQKKKQDRERMFAESESPDPETIQFYTTTGKTLQTPSSTRTSRSPSGGFSGLGGLGLGDVFASFSRKTRSSSTSPPSTSPPGGPSMTESQISAPIHLMHPMHIVHPTPIPESPEDHEHDKPLSSDPEKSSITPPPESLHPAFHVLPGTSSRPAYRPGLGFTINELDGRETGRRSGSIGGSIGARSEGMSMSGSEGIVSPMSTPNTNERVSSKGFSAMGTPPFNLIAPASSMNIPQGYGHEHGHGHGQVQGTWHSNTAPNNLPPNGPAPIQSQFNTQSYHRRNNSSTNNSNGGSSSPNPYTINQPQAQAQTQYAQQLAQARRTNATIVENPYQMYRDSREHQQNMGYQNALERAQAQDQGRSQGQVQSRVQRQMPAQKGKERERVSEGTDKNGQENEEGSGLKREISTHSIPIGLSLDAQPSASHPNPQKRNRETNPRDQNAQLQVHATLYGNHGGLPEPLHRRTQTQPSYIRTHTHSGSGSHSRSGPGPGSVSSIGNSASSPSPNPNPNHMRSMSSTKQWNHRIPVIGSGSGSENGKQQPGFTAPGFDFECRVVAPTPP
ncbi:hypothetical protein OCU04_009259 [Sclerotinia nivalis]|nr:hypothetical protein OCU04_009259 [Sclerotinia nivalis]